MKIQSKVNLWHTITLLSLIFILAQICFFIIHFKVTELIDTFVNNSISSNFLYPSILFPIIQYIAVQCLAYALIIMLIWFVAQSLGELFKLSHHLTYLVGLGLWCFAMFELLLLNQYYFPNSFFASFLNDFVSRKMNVSILLLLTSLLIVCVIAAYINVLRTKHFKMIGSVFIMVAGLILSLAVHDLFVSKPTIQPFHRQPNIIFIGMDSLRPDFVNYFGRKDIHTPNIDQFLANSTVFTNAYTPLARTFPSWVGILTAKYPKHSGARNNLIDATLIFSNDTIAKHFQSAGYETIYATDEKRFSNITSDYGFDRIIGPEMGVNDFILGGLSDLPVTNLLTKLSISRFLLPYNYGNRAAAITYEPDNFLKLVKLGLGKRSNKPLFLAVHLCLSHWPYAWASRQIDGLQLPDAYHGSIEGVDQQLGKLLQILNDHGLLQNALVVLLSDHGTTLGLVGDRFINQKNFIGDPQELKILTISRLSDKPYDSVDYAHDYSINTAYGYGSDILSLKQNHVLLAFRSFYLNPAIPKQTIKQTVSLVDISPTILDYLHLKPLKKVDGVSLNTYFSGKIDKYAQRDFFMETADRLSELDSDQIYIEKVLKNEIAIYRINPKNGLISMNPEAETSLIRNKQFCIMQGKWLFASYPPSQLSMLALDKIKKSFVIKTNQLPPYYVLINLETGQWTFDLYSRFANSAPLSKLIRQFKQFYRDELTISPRRIPRAN